MRAKVAPIPTPPERMAEAAAEVVQVLERFSRDSTKMRVLAMASTAYGRDGDASWFLETAGDAEARAARCGRCGHVHGKTRTHW